MLSLAPSVGAAPLGSVTEFSAGITPGSGPTGIAAGPDGNLWFTENAGNRIGRIGAAAPAASVVAPSVFGSGQQGTQQVCQGDRWATWAGEQPAQSGVQWQRDGAPIPGATSQTYTPPAGDIGHQLTCTVTVNYQLLRVTTSVTSSSVTVIAQPSGPPGVGVPGPPGQNGAPGPTGPRGRTARITCRIKGPKRKPKVVCRVRLVGSQARKARWRLTRGKHTIARGAVAVSHGRATLDTGRLRGLHRGRYRLTLTTRERGGRSVIATQSLRVR